MQPDLFNDSRNTMLRNDVLQALTRHDCAGARVARQKLLQEYPDDPNLPAFLTLIETIDATQQQSQAAATFADHASLREARLTLLEHIAPAAKNQMGEAGAALWLRVLWQDLIARARHLPFDADAEADHSAAMLLSIGDWQAAVDAVGRIESWRRIPAPLAWMAQAKLHLYGLKASWALLAELAWLSPKRLDVLIQASPDPSLQRLRDRFDAGFEPVEGSTAECDLVWFPAWVLTQQPQLGVDLALAQTGQHSAPEQAMRLLVNLLGLERQGRLHDIVKHRKHLRDLNACLYRAYMSTR